MANIKAGMESKTIKSIQYLYQSYNPGYSFDYNFLSIRIFRLKMHHNSVLLSCPGILPELPL